MSVYIYLEPPFDYMVTDANGRQKSEGTLDKLANFPKLKTRGLKIGVVPGQCVGLRSVEIPTKNAAKISKMLPNALEEDVIGDIDTLFFCFIGPTKQKEKHALIVERSLLDSWVVDAKEAGIQLDYILPDFALMPVNETAEYRFLVDQKNYVYVQAGYFNRKKIRRELLGLWLNTDPKLGNQKNVPKNDRTISIACNDEALLRGSGFVAAKVILESIGTHWKDWIGESHRDALDFNLLKEDYIPNHRRNKYGGLKYAIGFFLLATFIQMGSDGYDYVALKKENTRLDHEIETLFLDTFPNVKRIVNPRVQMRNQIAALEGGTLGGNEMLVILSLVSPVMRLSNVEFQSMEYHNGELVFVSLFRNFSLLDRFHRQLKSTDGLVVILGSSGSQDGKVSGRFVAKLK